MTFDATVNPVVYEGGVPVFIDTEYDTWNMDPTAFAYLQPILSLINISTSLIFSPTVDIQFVSKAFLIYLSSGPCMVE